MKKSGKKISFFKKSGNNHGTPHVHFEKMIKLRKIAKVNKSIIFFYRLYTINPPRPISIFVGTGACQTKVAILF